MKVRSDIRTIIIVLLLIILLPMNQTTARENVAIQLGGDVLSFTTSSGQPFIDVNNRTQVPVRLVLEAYGAEVDWNEAYRIVEILYQEVLIEIPIGEKMIYRDGVGKEIDTAAIIINGRTYLPIRTVIEALGGSVGWDGEARAVDLSHGNVEGVTGFETTPYMLGIRSSAIVAIYGEPQKVIPSIYGFDWWLYPNGYDGYLQLGIYKDVLEAIYVTKDHKDWPYEVSVGMTLDEASAYGTTKNFSGQMYDIKGVMSDTCAEAQLDDLLLWSFVDDHEDFKINALIAVREDYVNRWRLDGYPQGMTISSYEKQIYELTNVFRVKHGLEPMILSEALSSVARAHSEDMEMNHYFAHNNQVGATPFKRMGDADIEFRTAAENIAQGQTNAINVVNAWINSKGHRKNMLADYTTIGVGVSKGRYYTQDFIKQR